MFNSQLWQSSVQVILRGSTYSHLVQVAGLYMLTHPEPSDASPYHRLYHSVVWENCPVLLTPPPQSPPRCCATAMPLLLPLPSSLYKDSCQSDFNIRGALVHHDLLAWGTLNFSDRPLMGSCSLVECLYRAMLFKDRGSPNHFQRNDWWSSLVPPLLSLAPRRLEGSSLGRTPCWYTQANLCGSQCYFNKLVWDGSIGVS